MASHQDYKSYSKLAQIYNCYKTDYPVLDLVQKILQKEGDINYKVPSNSRSKEPNLIGGTALHLAAIKNNVEIFDTLLLKGADFTIQNQQGRTPLHCLVNQSDVKKELLDIVFSTHLSLGDPSNPCDVDGISHFHIACMKDHANAVEFFLMMGIPVDMTINADSRKFAGYTGLHIAAENCALATIKVLLNNNASINVKDARGWTPFHVMLEKKIKTMDSQNREGPKISNSWTISEIDDVLHLLRDINDELGLTDFHVACTMQDTAVAEYYLGEQNVEIDQQVKMNSPFRPGYTALHFALHCNLKTAKLLLRKNANFEVRDANGLAPMDLFWQLSKWDDLSAIIESKWKDAWFGSQDSLIKTRLLDFISATRDIMILRGFISQLRDLSASINEGPTCWKGRTLLHFATLMLKSDKTMKAIMNSGFVRLVDVQDESGATAAHLAFRANKLEFAEMFIDCGWNTDSLVDSEGLSYLHIACFFKKPDYVERYCRQAKNRQAVYRAIHPYKLIKPGSTALHVAMATGHFKVINILLEHGMDLNAEDDEGQTPLHRLFQLKDKTESVCRVLLSSDRLTDRMLENFGLTRLHMAIYCSDINYRQYINAKTICATVNCNDPSSFMYFYDGCTPLRMAIKNRASVETIQTLIERGGDLLWTNRHGDTPFYAALSGKFHESITHLMFATLRDNTVLQRLLEAMSGITMLHLACHIVVADVVTSLLKESSDDVDARVKMSCPVWTGCTPIHVLLKAVQHCGISDNVSEIFGVLLKKGADMFSLNDDGETPIHLALRDFPSERAYKVLSLLVENLRVFNVNPMGHEGMSHFHAACLVKNAASVKLFLENSDVDVNQPVDFFATDFPGETPLHLALEHTTEAIFGSEGKQQTVEWLLKYGADANAEDGRGQTPLHKAVKTKRHHKILEKLVKRGARADSRNILEQTPLELLLQSDHVSVEGIKFFEKTGCRLNASNAMTEEGYISMLISQHYHSYYQVVSNDNLVMKVQTFPRHTQCFNTFVNTDGWNLPDDKGRTLLHNIVTTNDPNYDVFSLRDLIDRFLAVGVDIDVKDQKGMTALHLAAKFGNSWAVKELLIAGADIDVLDSTDKSALEHAMEQHHDCKHCPADKCHVKVIAYLLCHIRTLHRLKFRVSKKIRLLDTEAMEHLHSRDVLIDGNPEKVYAFNLHSIPIDDSNLRVGDFLSDTGRGLVLYAFMSDERREKVDKFFRNYEYYWKFACARSYMKAVKKSLRLVKLAVDSVSKIAGVAVPIVCVEMIFQYLTNGELENFVKATCADERI